MKSLLFLSCLVLAHAASGAWTVRQGPATATGESEYFMVLPEKDPKANQESTLAIRVSGASYDILLATKSFLPTPEVTITAFFDDQPGVEAAWKVDPSYKSAVAQDSPALLRRLLASRKLRLAYESPDFQTIHRDFDLTGALEAWKPLAAHLRPAPTTPNPQPTAPVALATPPPAKATPAPLLPVSTAASPGRPILEVRPVTAGNKVSSLKVTSTPRPSDISNRGPDSSTTKYSSGEEQLEIKVTVPGQIPFEGEIHWGFIGKAPNGRDRQVFRRGLVPVSVPATEVRTYAAASGHVGATETRSSTSGGRTFTGLKLEGWVVQLVDKDQRILEIKASSPTLADWWKQFGAPSLTPH